MFHSLRRLTGRAGLTFVLVLATQLAYAGQLCHSIASAVPGQSRSDASNESPCVALAAQPCCDDATLHKAMCLSNPTDLGASVSGAAPVSASAPPASAWHLVAQLGAPSASPPLPAAPAGLSLPSYILFSRFLS